MEWGERKSLSSMQSDMLAERELRVERCICRCNIGGGKAKRRFRSSHELTCPEPAFDLQVCDLQVQVLIS